MKFIYRLGFYLGGFTIGLIILFFFLGGKKTSCDYGPEARTLKNIRIKPRLFSEESIISLSEKGLDTSAIATLLRKGSVLFSESNTKLDSCKQYVIEGTISDTNLKIRVENCEEQATVLKVYNAD
ncbi:DUF4258 domain-containing protein [Ulvibacter litoralis]|uniref:DUF4258 domain-containing protein n=1 Tax=Ulvibacter litoralis TaxID=227084 RepID=A0A1G7FBP4_9FLAO|nr:DUF4258 domain-containing protein [Ulvibacter litoralis]GHC51867.1 hypothetical protein GCM10008083_14460 [Ulvibacter litoralis]SDE73266.1 hypothetical protein SAMN05421855_102457 [Ulvibacter litoralis]